MPAAALAAAARSTPQTRAGTCALALRRRRPLRRFPANTAADSARAACLQKHHAAHLAHRLTSRVTRGVMQRVGPFLQKMVVRKQRSGPHTRQPADVRLTRAPA